MPATRQQPETEILNAVRRYLATRADVLHFRINTGAATRGDGIPIRFGVTGGADLWGILSVPIGGRCVGVALFVEIKTESGRQSEPQKDFEAAVMRHGAVYILARSVEDVAKGLEGARADLTAQMQRKALA